MIRPLNKIARRESKPADPPPGHELAAGRPPPASPNKPQGSPICPVNPTLAAEVSQCQPERWDGLS